MTNQQRRFSFYLSPVTGRMFFAFVLTLTFCFGGTIIGYAQAATATEPHFGAIDPLLENFKSPRPPIHDSYKNTAPDADAAKRTTSASPVAGELDGSLNVNIDTLPGSASETVVQTDGKILIGGYFRTVNNIRHKSIVRLNADFSLDSTFSANVNGTVLAIAVQTDGKIIIGGSFTMVGGASRNRIARLNSDGSLDTTFNPGAGADALVYDVAVQTDGKIIVGGNFYRVNSINNYCIARLNADGSVDNAFASPIPTPVPTTFPPPSFQVPSIIYSLAVQTDGKIFIGGYIVTSNPHSSSIAFPILRLNQNGAYDPSFDPGTTNDNAQKIALQPDGKIVIVGWFSAIDGVNRNFIARFNADGSLDMTFNVGTGASAPVFAVAVQTDGKILLAGLFTVFNGADRNRIARLNADGSLDTTFNPAGGSFSTGIPQSIISLPNGKILAGGSFGGGSIFGGSDSIRVFNSDGSLDTSVRFETAALGGVRAIAVQPDGKILVGGNFTRPRSGTLNRIFRLNADGSIDTSFGAGSTFFVVSNAQVNSIVVQPDGKILFAGRNVSSGNSFSTDVVRVNADGSADNTFTAADLPTSGVNAMALQPDGKIVVVWGVNSPPRSPSGGIARLNADGSLDSTFNSNLIPSSAAALDSVVIQSNGKILVGGLFSLGFVNSQTGTVFYNGVIRLNANGSRDTTFIPATVSNDQEQRFTEVSALALQADGKILIGGRIFTGGVTSATGAARLNADGSIDTTFNSGAISSVADIAHVKDIFPLPNGKILIGGLFNSIGTASLNNVARLNADGSTDVSFSAMTDNTVYKIVTQADGKVLIGGDFETVNGVVRTSLARLLSEFSTRRAQFDFDGDGKSDVSVFRPENGSWYVQRSSNGFFGLAFGVASDRIVPADYDGDGKTDIAVYRSGTWYLQRSQLGFTGVSFGNSDDIPQPADFDGDGRAELAVFRPSNGIWYILNLADNRFSAVAFGQTGDKPAAADYDGDGKTDVAVFRPSNGVWYLQQSTAGFRAITFGLGTDVPTAADYDGDGKADLAVYRGGTWYLNRSTQGFTGVIFGAATDKPIPNAFVQ